MTRRKTPSAVAPWRPHPAPCWFLISHVISVKQLVRAEEPRQEEQQQQQQPHTASHNTGAAQSAAAAEETQVEVNESLRHFLKRARERRVGPSVSPERRRVFNCLGGKVDTVKFICLCRGLTWSVRSDQSALLLLLS